MKIQIAAKASQLLIVCAGFWYCLFETVMHWYYNYDLTKIFHLDGGRSQEFRTVNFISAVFLGLALLMTLSFLSWFSMVYVAARRLDDSRTYFRWHEVITLWILPLLPLKLMRDACKGFIAVLQKHGIDSTVQAKKCKRAITWWWLSSLFLLAGSCVSGRIIDYAPEAWGRLDTTVIHYPLYIVITISVLTVIFILLSLNMIKKVSRLAKEAIAFRQTEIAITEHLVD